MSKSVSNMSGVLSGQKFVKKKLLNLFGLHIFRILVANVYFNIRSKKLFSEFTNEEEILKTDGVIVIHDFLPLNEFEGLKNEFDNQKKYEGNEQIIDEGDSTWVRKKFSRRHFEKMPFTKKFLTNQKLLKFINIAESRILSIPAVWFDTVSYEKRVSGIQNSSEVETFHSDISFPSHKVFFLIHDVKDEDGPLTFCPGSNKFSLRRLWLEYKKSNEYDRKENDAFYTITKKEESFLKLNSIKGIVPKNTLIIMNGNIFHKRGNAIPGAKRSMIFTQFRFNPFSLETKHDV
jgi:hypothetical protein